jgi:erythromycin esterase
MHKLNSSKDLDALIEDIGDRKVVMLGEASHGTHEYYTWRMALSRRLIEEKGFNFIAVEGDWPDCYKINRFVKGYKDAGDSVKDVLLNFDRWPTWMWANWEVAALAEWLREHNQTLSGEKKVGFYGLDVYSLWDSMYAIMDYLEKEDPQAAQAVKSAIKCFEPFQEDEQMYARYSLTNIPVVIKCLPC